MRRANTAEKMGTTQAKGVCLARDCGQAKLAGQSYCTACLQAAKACHAKGCDRLCDAGEVYCKECLPAVLPCATYHCRYEKVMGEDYCRDCLDEQAAMSKAREHERRAAAASHTREYFPQIAGDYACVDAQGLAALYDGQSEATQKAIKHFHGCGAGLRGAYLFHGSHGTGKTYLAHLILKTFFLAGALRFRAKVIHPQFYMRLHSIRHHAFAEADSDNSRSFYRHLLQARVLIIDEIGKDMMASDYFSNFMFEVVDERASLRGKSMLTIFISNSAPEKLARSHRFLASDRMVLFTPVHFVGHSKRRRPSIEKKAAQERFDFFR